MSTNIGIGLTGNFKKTINPIVLQSYNIPTKEEDITGVGDFEEFLSSDSLSNKILRVIQSLDTKDATSSIEEDENPLDNIIRAEVIDLLNYRKISKLHIQRAFDRITAGQDPFYDFTEEENLILLNQARQLEYITQQEFEDLIIEPTALYFNSPDEYKEILNFQLNLPSNIPTIDELKIAGIVDFIISTVKENPEAVIDETLVRTFSENYIDEILLTTEFIGYTNCSKILADPEHILNILDKQTFNIFANRMAPYLDFITEEKIDIVMGYLPSQYLNITDVFSENQLRLMIDKELDIKNTILKTLSLTEVQDVFNELSITFKREFTEAFTEEKLKEMITITIGIMFPVKNNTDIYTDLCIEYNIDIDSIDIDIFETKLQEYYNN